jgi:hypothetical protein
MAKVAKKVDERRKAQIELLRATFRGMNAERAQEIREAFYKVADGLTVLLPALEMADLDGLGGGPNGVLLEEHLLVCEVAERFEKLSLGAVL